jgi:thymidylate synthase
MNKMITAPLTTKFDETYFFLIDHILKFGEHLVNKRTNNGITQCFGITVPWNMKYYPLLTCRQMFPKTAAAEIAWMLSGTKSLTFLQKYTKIWNGFANQNNEIDSAYGYRWQHTYEIDQLAKVISHLKEDPTSRQEILMTWYPPEDMAKKLPNVPCIYSLVVNIVNNKLNLMVTIRSNDLIIGFPYDMMIYTLLGNCLAHELEIDPGEILYSVANMHIYDIHKEGINKLNQASFGEFEIKGMPYIINLILTHPDDFVEMIDSDTKLLGYKNDYPRISFGIVK